MHGLASLSSQVLTLRSHSSAEKDVEEDVVEDVEKCVLKLHRAN